MKQYQKITANFSGLVRHDSMAGRDYIVAPMVMIVEGVLDGSGGPMLYSNEEMSKFPRAWNNKPVVVYHPSMNGQGISACDPEVITTHGIGVIMNARFEDDKLKAEAWFEENRANEVDDRVMTAVENNTVLELSTGLYVENDGVAGNFNGTEYIGVARNFQPDHLAILPDITGACSVEDGAGFLRTNSSNQTTMNLGTELTSSQRSLLEANESRFIKLLKNELSFDGIREIIYTKLRESQNDSWIAEVYDDYFIYEIDGKYYKQEYSIENDLALFKSIPVQVVREVNYKIVSNRKESSMNKKEIVDGLISNESTKWNEEDRDVLMNMEDATLNKLTPDEESETPPIDNATTPPVETPAVEAPPVSNTTMEDYLKDAPAEVRQVLTNALATQKIQKDKLIAGIVVNERNTFTAGYLATKDLQELESISALAVNEVTEEPEMVRFNYAGQAPVGNAVDPKTGGEPLLIPSIDD